MADGETTGDVGAEGNSLEVAIVGGGIAGLYCLYRLLKNKEQFKNIRLFESCDHLGGRIETWSLKRAPGEIGYAPTWDPRHLLGELKDHNTSPYDDPKTTEYLRAEFGPMRIEPRDQPLLQNLLNELGITEPESGAPESLDDLIPFFPYTSKEPESAKFILTAEEAEQKNIMDLLLLGIRRILEIVKENENLKWKNPKAKEAWGNLRSGKSFHKHYWKGELLDWINHLEDFDLDSFTIYYRSQQNYWNNKVTKEKEIQEWLKNNSDYHKIRLHFEIDGHPLWDMGFWNLMSDVLSHYAVVKIRDWGTYYHFLHENLNAAEWLVFWLKAIKGTHALRGIRGGMSRIIYALLFRLCELINQDKLQTRINQEFKSLQVELANQIATTKKSDDADKNINLKECEKEIFRLVKRQKDLTDIRNTFNDDARLFLFQQFNWLSVEKQKEIFETILASTIKVGYELATLELINGEQGKVKLKFSKSDISEIVTDHVILALPKLPLDKLETPLPQVLKENSLEKDAQQCRAALTSVKCLPLLKCFFVVEHPWWTEDRELNADAADVPTREITYSRSKDKTRGMIMIYTDHPAITFWSDYLREFKQAAEPEQTHYTIWWKDKFPLPSDLEKFDHIEGWKEAWKELALQWKEENGNHENFDSDNIDLVKENWEKICCWWAALSAKQQKNLRNKLRTDSTAEQFFSDKEKQQERLWNRFVQFARDYEHHDFLADHLLACGIHDWGKAPFGAAAHGWLPGEQSRKHIDYLAAFPQNGKWKESIHVCGEAFSDYQGFIEGSLRSAEEALRTILKPNQL
nr:FAD/NAD(P)-binding protein [Nitrosomonas nitrosa]